MVSVADTLTLTQIAEAVGLSRQRLYQISREDRTFPHVVGQIANAVTYDATEARRWAKRNGRQWSE